MDRIYEGFGIEIFADGEKRYLKYDAGHFNIVYKTIEISLEDALIAQQSEKDAYNIIVKYKK